MTDDLVNVIKVLALEYPNVRFCKGRLFFESASGGDTFSTKKEWKETGHDRCEKPIHSGHLWNAIKNGGVDVLDGHTLISFFSQSEYSKDKKSFNTEFLAELNLSEKYELALKSKKVIAPKRPLLEYPVDFGNTAGTPSPSDMYFLRNGGVLAGHGTLAPAHQYFKLQPSFLDNIDSIKAEDLSIVPIVPFVNKVSKSLAKFSSSLEISTVGVEDDVFAFEWFIDDNSMQGKISYFLHAVDVDSTNRTTFSSRRTLGIFKNMRDVPDTEKTFFEGLDAQDIVLATQSNISGIQLNALNQVATDELAITIDYMGNKIVYKPLKKISSGKDVPCAFFTNDKQFLKSLLSLSLAEDVNLSNIVIDDLADKHIVLAGEHTNGEKVFSVMLIKY